MRWKGHGGGGMSSCWISFNVSDVLDHSDMLCGVNQLPAEARHRRAEWFEEVSRKGFHRGDIESWSKMMSPDIVVSIRRITHSVPTEGNGTTVRIPPLTSVLRYDGEPCTHLFR